MLSASRHTCLPRLIAIYVLAYAAVTILPWFVDWWQHAAYSSHPVPSPIVNAASSIQKIILPLWVPLSFFIWRRHIWARWLTAYSALVLGLAQCASYTDMLRLYGSASIVSETLVLAVPTLFLSALVFCPLVGDCFAAPQASNPTMQPTAGR